jgi:hypothetical protein
MTLFNLPDLHANNTRPLIPTIPTEVETATVTKYKDVPKPLIIIGFSHSA